MLCPSEAKHTQIKWTKGLDRKLIHDFIESLIGRRTNTVDGEGKSTERADREEDEDSDSERPKSKR